MALTPTACEAEQASTERGLGNVPCRRHGALNLQKRLIDFFCGVKLKYNNTHKCDAKNNYLPGNLNLA